MDNDKSKYTYGEQMNLPAIFQNIGFAHKSTSQTSSLDKEMIQEDFLKYQDKCVHSRNRFENYIDEFEQRRYMSPVELLICTHYRDIDVLFNDLINRLEQFNSELNEINEWKYSRCYGSKNIKHLFESGHLYQNSHDYYYHGNPVLDVTSMVRNYAELFEWDETKLTGYFSSYLKGNPLDTAELFLFDIYLLDPTDYFQTVERYVTRGSENSMIEHIMLLKRCHRKLVQLNGFVNRNPIDEDEEMD
ncbi:hypothetical protein VBD025_09935 [Virgibacillus flavescens]|uniref:hypothetical protein n=1 Tax=Virgibacillus flavescens TaxID=1611422 RepID=UPI003D356EF0